MAFINIGLIFFLIQINQVKNIFTLEYITEGKYPFVLPFSDDDYFNVITNNISFKMNKENGAITFYNSGITYDKEPIYCDDKLKKSFLFYSEKVYSINSNEFISVIDNKGNSNQTNFYGCLTSMNDDDDFFIYGVNYNNGNKLAFFKPKKNKLDFEDIEYDIGSIEKVSCKYINEGFICAMIINEHIHIYLLTKDSKKNFFSLNMSKIDSGLYVNLALYDTTIVGIKILCKQEKENDMKIWVWFS